MEQEIPNAFEPVPFTVVGENVIIEFGEQPEETVTAGGVIVPSAQKVERRRSVATVVGAGPKAMVQYPPPTASALGVANLHPIIVGDVLIVHRHRMTQLVLEDEGDRELWVIDPTSIIAIVD